MAMQELHNSPVKDNLFAAMATFPVVSGKLEIQVAASRGTLVTSGGAKATNASDAYAVLAVDVEGATSSAKVEAPVYLTGEFNVTALNEATGITIADGAVIQNRIFVRKNIEA